MTAHMYSDLLNFISSTLNDFIRLRSILSVSMLSASATSSFKEYRDEKLANFRSLRQRERVDNAKLIQ
jgi:hypothetical protein